MNLRNVSILVVLCCFQASAAEARTERIFHADGQGYRDVIRNDRGGLIGETHYNALGQKQKAMIVDLDADTVSEIDYEQGQPKVKRVMEVGGRLIRTDRFDAKGNVMESTLHDDAGPVFVTRFHYDGQDRVILAVRQKADGGVLGITDYSYEGDRLRKALRKRQQEDGRETKDRLVLDESGSVLEAAGDTTGILEGSRPPAEVLPPSARETLDHTGNRVRVKLNRNATYDVTIFDKLGRVISWEKLRPGDCPGDDLCPVIEKVPGLNNQILFTSR